MSKKKSFFGKLFSGMLFGSNKFEGDILKEEQMQSPFRTMVRTFFENKIAVMGLIFFALIFILIFTLSAIYPIDLTLQDTTQQNIAPGLDLMSFPSQLQGKAAKIDTGSTFGVGIDVDGNTYMWGKPDPKILKVVEKTPIDSYKLKDIAAGLDHIVGITTDGKAVTWSANRFKLNEIPKDLAKLDNAKQAAAGFQFSVVITEDGKMFIWGSTNFLGSLKQYTIPADVQGNVEKIDVSTDNVITLLKDGTVRVLGAETPSFNYVPELTNIVDIAATDDMMAALNSDGKITVWGNARYDQEKVPEINEKVVGISGGRNHFTAVTESGKVYAWGRDNYGQASVPSSLQSDSAKATAVYSGYFQNYAVDGNGNITSFGHKGYLMGTDHYGRDVFTRLVSGGRLSLTVGAVAVIIAVIIGIIVGGFSGYYGGTVDIVLMRFAEIVGSIPFLPIAMTLSVVVGNRLDPTQKIIMIMVILGVLSWAGLAKLVRAQILAVRSSEYVLAAKATGIKESNIIFKHIIPNVMSVIVVNVTLQYAGSMLTESTLSFLGFGVVEPQATWGNMLTGSQSSATILNYWWRWVFPALALSISTISINLIGDGLQAAIDPKANER